MVSEWALALANVFSAIGLSIFVCGRFAPMEDKKMATISEVRLQLSRITKVGELIHQSRIGVRELAGFVQVSPSTICRVRRGLPPDIRTALRLAKFFETTVEELFKEFE